ncbi:MAG: hypothetical protein WC942_10635 [Clostridia bacterium]|jgi:hypothetical protein
MGWCWHRYVPIKQYVKREVFGIYFWNLENTDYRICRKCKDIVKAVWGVEHYFWLWVGNEKEETIKSLIENKDNCYIVKARKI